MGSRARSPRIDLLREVLRAAVDVARARAADAPASVPAPLRPVVSMQRLTPRALAAADRAGDDDGFRAEVREALADVDVGEAGRLWLDRPEGWADEVDRLVEARAEASGEGDARRTLVREQRARSKAEAVRDDALAELARRRDEADRLRAEHEAASDRARADAERAEDAQAARIRAVRELKGMEARLAQAHEELREVRAARDAAEARADDLARQAEDAAVRADDLARRAGASTEPSPSDVESTSNRRPTREDEASEAFDRRAAARAIQAAAGAAAGLAASLTDLAGALGAPADPAPPAPAASTAAATAPRGPRRTARPAPRRSVARLPGGIHDDTPEAAAHLVRLPGCALLVDGYNATMATWPGRSLPEQRERRVAALDEMEARVGVDTTVVFDGVEERWARSGSRRVHVHFTPAGVEADDVILELVDVLADDRPVVVASDDRRVRDGARRRGAHTIGIDQLRALVT